MGFNFPNTPADGALFQPGAGMPTYTWSAATGAWKLASGGLNSGVYVGDNPPAAPVNGMLWMNSATGIWYVWYVDPNSSQWVAISGGAPASVKTARTRNRVINPTAQVSQENGTNFVSTTGTYPADQWALFSSIASPIAQKATLAIPTPEGTTSYVAFNTGTAKPSLAAGDALRLILPIEGLDVADLAWGTASAKQIVLRFWAMCDIAGTYGFAINNSANNRSYCGSFTLAAAGVGQVFSFAIPGDTTGTWLKDTGIGMLIDFTSAAGSTYVGAAGWQAGNFFAPVGCTNGAAQASKSLAITDVGLYADPDNTGVAPRFEAPSYEDDLARCQRYYQRLNGLILQGYNTSSGTIFENYSYQTTMRATPSVVIGNIANVANCTGLAMNGSTSATTAMAMATVTASGVGTVTFDLGIYARLI